MAYYSISKDYLKTCEKVFDLIKVTTGGLYEYDMRATDD